VISQELEEELAHLTTDEKAAVARSLIDALDEKWDQDVARLWMEETERRYAAYRRGEVTTSLASDVFSRVPERLRRPAHASVKKWRRGCTRPLRSMKAGPIASETDFSTTYRPMSTAYPSGRPWDVE